jgi:release factor glutamine methyltransferase
MKKAPQKIFRYHDLVIEVSPEVYDPAEDSFLLLETFVLHPKTTVLEIGAGCGLLSLECARRGARVICTDINPFAVQNIKKNIEKNKKKLKGSLEVRQGDLFSVIKENERFDVILFNPPYLPTTEAERVGGWFDVATDGGRDGLVILRRFLNSVRTYLVPSGRAYVVFSSLAKRSELEQCLKKNHLSSEVIASYVFEGEQLDVYVVAPTG